MTAPTPARRRPLLRELHIFGLDHLDPLILAALADQHPLLFIGAHGTAKSELLNRLAQALSLSHRHYNASLISFDDLLGYPVPNARRDGLEYLRTPVDLWDAESVFLDEISRCRPEHQNKLFSIIHERRVQGLPLERLRYCWSAMNPPVSLDGEETEGETYHGSLPLDPALADRFAWVVEIPAFEDLGPEDRTEIIAHGGETPAAWPDLHALIESVRDRMRATDPALKDWIEKYVNGLVAPLRDAGLSMSGRRAVILARNVRTVQAVCEILGHDTAPGDVAYLTLKWSLPQRAQGRAVPEHRLAAAHREAAKAAGEPQSGVWARLRSERDPVKRLALALRHEALNRIELSQLAADAWAGLTVGERYVLARNVLPALREDRLTAAALETLMEPLGKVLAFTEEDLHRISIPRSRAREWDRLLAAIQNLRRRQDPDSVALGNLLYTLFVVEEAHFDPEALIERDRQWRALFRPCTDEAAA